MTDYDNSEQATVEEVLAWSEAIGHVCHPNGVIIGHVYLSRKFWCSKNLSGPSLTLRFVKRLSGMYVVEVQERKLAETQHGRQFHTTSEELYKGQCIDTAVERYNHELVKLTLTYSSNH